MPDPSRMPWPRDTQDLYNSLIGNQQHACHPVYLLLRATKWHPGWEQLDRNDRNARSVKDFAFRAAVRRMAAPKDLVNRTLARRRAWVEPLVGDGRARVLKLTALTPCVVHLSSPGPLELGLALHHVYGFPVLPATSLKGLARAASREDRRNTIYGVQDSAGAVTVLDGLPLKFSVSKDVMTVHQPGWYGQGRGNRMPCDRDDPTPIPFLSIDAGAEFEVVLIARDREASHWLDIVEEDLRRGVDERGLGAKTAAGYGWFKIERIGISGPARPPSGPGGGTVSPPGPGSSSQPPESPKTNESTPPPPDLSDPYQSLLYELRALNANAGNIGSFLEFWLKLKDDAHRREFACLVVEKMTPKWVKDQAKTKEKWKQLWEFYRQLQPGQ